VKKIIKLGTPEFLELLKEWNRKLGPEFNRIDTWVRLTGWSFDARAQSSMSIKREGYTPETDAESRPATDSKKRWVVEVDQMIGGTLADTDGYQASDLIASAAKKLPKSYKYRLAIMEWANGTERMRDGISAVARRHGFTPPTLNRHVHLFLKKLGIDRNPWGCRKSVQPEEPVRPGPVKHLIKNGRPVSG
jgi:hypothetical protein